MAGLSWKTWLCDYTAQRRQVFLQRRHSGCRKSLQASTASPNSHRFMWPCLWYYRGIQSGVHVLPRVLPVIEVSGQNRLPWEFSTLIPSPRNWKTKPVPWWYTSGKAEQAGLPPYSKKKTKVCIKLYKLHKNKIQITVAHYLHGYILLWS